MAYKTLMTHLCGAELDEDFLLSVAQQAADFDAHLDVLCHGVDRMTPGFHYGGVDPLLLQQTLQIALDEAKSLSEQAKALMARSAARWGVEQLVNPIGGISRSVGMRARFADLAVVQSPYTDGMPRLEAEAILEGALFAGQSPVLVLPRGAKALAEPKTVIIGWNESAEAVSAVRAALPLLQQAHRVRVTVIDPPRHGADRSDPGGPLSIFLARHGVKAEIDVLGKSLPRVSDVLLRHASDKNADMIVMGAYGHSRFREAILGGATRDMLESATLPVFMMH